MYRPNWWPEDKSLWSIVLEVHMFTTGASDLIDTEELYIKCLEHALSSWTPTSHKSEEFDNAFKHVIEIVLDEYNRSER